MPKRGHDAERWLPEARAGSQEAVSQALEACRGYLLLIVQRELAPDLRAKAGASDLVQDTIMEAQRDFAGFQGGSDGCRGLLDLEYPICAGWDSRAPRLKVCPAARPRVEIIAAETLAKVD
jgi:hypothetical protein